MKKNGYVEFQRTSRLRSGGADQQEQRAVPGEGPGADSEGSHPHHSIRIDKESRHITLAYFEQKSTVDYIGVVQGIPVCFDAKECHADTFPLANIHEHQMKFMEEFEGQEGVAFLLIYYAGRDEFYICL